MEKVHGTVGGLLFPRGVAGPAPHLFGWVRQSHFNANLLQFRDAVARMAGFISAQTRIHGNRKSGALGSQKALQEGVPELRSTNL